MKIPAKISIVEKSSAWIVKAVPGNSRGDRGQLKRHRPRYSNRAVVGLGIFLGLVIFLASVVSAETTYYLHSDGGACSPGPSGSASILTLDGTSPTATQAKCRDSAGVNRTTFQQIGTWSAATSSQAKVIAALSDL